MRGAATTIRGETARLRRTMAGAAMALCVLLSLGLSAGHAQTDPPQTDTPTATTAPAPSPAVNAPAPANASCEGQSEAQMRARIEAIYTDTFADSVETLDYERIVERAWVQTGVDGIIDAAVDDALEEARTENSYFRKLWSGYDPNTAEDIANTMATRVFESPRVTTAFTDVSVLISERITARLGTIADVAADPALVCMRSYLQARYGETVTTVVQSRIRDQQTMTAFATPTASGAGGDIALVISGVILIVMQRVIQRIVTRMAGRILGRIAARFAGLIGVAIFAYELLTPNAVINDIAQELKSDTVKTEIRAEVTRDVRETIIDQAPEIARQSAASLLEGWAGFEQSNRLVLRVAETSPDFNAFINRVPPDNWVNFSDAIGLVIDLSGGTQAMLRLLDQGRLERLPEIDSAGLTILRDTESLERLTAWQINHPGTLSRVVALDLHQVIRDPSTVAPDEMVLIIAAPTAAIARKLYDLDQTDRETLASALDDGDRVDIATRLSSRDLSALAQYLRELPPDARDQLIYEVKRDPAVFGRFAGGFTRAGIAASRDQVDAIRLVARRSDWWDMPQLMSDFLTVADGRVDARLFLISHKLVSAGLGLVAFLLAFNLLQLILGFGRALAGGGRR